jgi:hypothetical protein
MRKLGTTLALIASAQIVVLSTPAFAQDEKPGDKTEKKGDKAAPDKTSDKKDEAADTKDAEKKEGTEAAGSAQTKEAPSAQVEVHVESPVAVSLERRQGDGAWEHVCVSPCEGSDFAHNAALTPVDAEYRIVGTELNPSKLFRLDASKSKVTLKVTPGYLSRERAGLYVLGAGGLVALGGVVLILVGTGGDKTFNPDDQTHTGNTDILGGGIAMILAGVGAGIFGGAWMIDNGRSVVEGGVISTKPEKAPPPGPIKLDVNGTAGKNELRMPGFTSVPLLRGTF